MRIRIRLLFAVLCFPLGFVVANEPDKTPVKRIVTIESAKSTEYIKRPESEPSSESEVTEPAGDTAETDMDTPETDGEAAETDVNESEPVVSTGTPGAEVIRLRGNVSIVVTEGASVSKIQADEVIYDKERETLDAQGNVLYEHTTGKRGFQRFEGEALLFDIKKQEGVFLKGVITRDSGKQDGDPFIVHSEMTGRDTSTTIAFKKGVLTTCDKEDPHWSIRASRIWMLPGNEIALLNGIFFVGPLPVFYIPFFYYPGDEMIFHPVFGYRNREGYFTQTTTYLYGRKPLPEKDNKGETTFADFLQGDILKEQRREGLFFRNLEEDAKEVNKDYFKIMVDAYSSLGYMLGFDGSFTGTGYIKSFSILGSIGFSKTLYEPQTGITYSTYDSEGEEHENSGYLFGTEVPFRYRSEIKMAMDKKPFQISINLPLVSDPKYKNDFFNRSEDLNWFDMLFDEDETTDETTTADETTYSWNISGSIRPDMTLTSPWLTTFSFNTISGVLTFNSKTNQTLSTEEQLYSPERTFYYPEIIRPEVRMTLGGTIYSTNKSAVRQNSGRGDTGKLENPFAEPEDDTKDKKEEKEDDNDPVFNRIMPDPGRIITSPQPFGGHSLSFTWGLDPSFIHETRYDSTNWLSTADIDWNNYASLYYQLKATARLKGDYSYDVNFFKVNTELNFTGTYQEHPWLSEDIYDTPEKISTVNKADYMASVFTLKNTDTATLKPFFRNPYLSPMSVSWKFTGDLLRQEFTGTGDEPEWEMEPIRWKKDYVDVHETSTVVGVAIGPYEQRVTFVNYLPPLLDSYSGALFLSWLYGDLNVSTRYFERETVDDTEWIWDPFRARLSWKLPYDITLGQEYIYDLELERHTRLSFTAAYKYFTGYYTVSSTIPYRMETGAGWVQKSTEQEFIPSEAGLAFNNTSKPLVLHEWKNRIALQARIISNLKFDLVKLTESNFTFSMVLTLKIHEFLDFSLSSTSTNEVIARYFQDYIDLPAPLPGETNLITDLVKSVNFFDNNDRKESGFKLKSLNFELTHYLHDWTMNFRTSIKPELKEEGNTYRYEFTPIISFIVQWKPVSDIKTTVRSEEGVFSLNDPEDEEEMAGFIPQ